MITGSSSLRGPQGIRSVHVNCKLFLIHKLTDAYKGGMPYFKQGQWEESGEDRRFRDRLVLLLLELGFSVRTKVKNAI